MVILNSIYSPKGMESPANRREADDSYRDAFASVGAFSFQQRPHERRYMAGIPDSLVIASWIVGSLWVVAVVAYLCEADTSFLVPLFALGAATGVIEYLLARRRN
jgi:hypothetical protein